MTPRQQLKKAVIMALHLDCKTYEEAVKKEFRITRNIGWDNDCIFLGEEKGLYILFDKKIFSPSLTLSRILQALNEEMWGYFFTHGEIMLGCFDGETIQRIEKICDWKLTKDNGETATDDDQTDETIEKLLSLLTK